MNRNRGRSVSQVQDDVVANIDAHLDFVKRFLRWSIEDLDRLVSILNARIAAEEAYVQSLSKIHKTVSPIVMNPMFGDKPPTFIHASVCYERSIDQTIQQRRELIKGMKEEVEKLTIVRDKQEMRRKNAKTDQGEANAEYANYRTGELTKLRKAYFKKCQDLRAAQSQFEQQQQQQQIQQMEDNAAVNDYLPQHYRPDDSKRLSYDSLDNDDASIHSQGHQDSAYKKGMANFMASMDKVRTQFANVGQPSLADLNKQNTKFAKYKKEIMDSDYQYRDGIRHLEVLRKRQVQAAFSSMKHLEFAILGKGDVTRSVLGGLLEKEHLVLVNELQSNEYTSQFVKDVNSRGDYIAFTTRYKNTMYRAPEPLLYENFYHGVCKQILFGGSLNEYAAEHEHTVPLLVTRCVEAIDNMGLQKEGIYRVSGRQSNIETLKHSFEEDEAKEIESHFDVFTIATVLKIYLRQLKEPLLQIDLQNRVKYSGFKDKDQQLKYLLAILSGISKPHRDTLFVVIRHLAHVNAHSAINKMNLQNLSVIFTPAIFHDFNQAEHPGEWHSDVMFEDLVNFHDTLFQQAELQSRAPAGPQVPLKSHEFHPTNANPVATTPPAVITPGSVSSVANATSSSLLLTAPMGPPPMIVNEPPTPKGGSGSRAASLGALQRSGSLQHPDAHPTASYFPPQLSSTPTPAAVSSGTATQHPQPPQPQQKQQHTPTSLTDPASYHYQPQQPQPQQAQPQRPPPRPYYPVTHSQDDVRPVPRPSASSYTPQINTSSLRTDSFYGGTPELMPSKLDKPEADATEPSNDDTMPTLASSHSSTTSTKKKFVPPRQDSLRTKPPSAANLAHTKLSGSANSSTSSLLAAVNVAAATAAALSNNDSSSSLPSPSSASSARGPPLPHPVVINQSQYHQPSSARVVPTSSPVTPTPPPADLHYPRQ
ncbi:RhoGAP-domain-containing protein [Hesseltinella vesiculosa]|uniref:RhoGAP-domain-containing protein n=1 Tax=Hesseltinella vesiculosa TaxID=101127 RepID=A0A1X2GRD7_9FUNG|nr:RhoGAP-domain-containing protein [Hesseltinella vesiculosa]